MSGPRYLRPADLEEVLAVLAEHGDDAKVLAGGQSLVPMMSAGLAAPAVLVDINDLAGLETVEVVSDKVRVGALARHRMLERPGPAVARAAPLLPAAAPFIAHPPIRNRGTFVGSIVHGDPSAEWPAVALALDATVHLLSSRGERTVAMAEFLLGPMMAAIEPDELAVEVSLPVAPPAATGACVHELAYRDGDYAIVGVAAQVRLGASGRVAASRIALFGVDVTPVRASDAEALLAEAGRAGVDDAAGLAQRAAEPMTDATASAGYRRDMIAVLCRRALRDAFARATAARDHRGG